MSARRKNFQFHSAFLFNIIVVYTKAFIHKNETLSHGSVFIWLWTTWPYFGHYPTFHILLIYVRWENMWLQLDEYMFMLVWGSLKFCAPKHVDLFCPLFNVSRIDEYRMERSPVQKIRLLYNSVKTFLLLKRKIHGSFEVKFETENDCKKYEK